MMAYLTMMAVRLLELHRVLKATGSLYLHCDPTASHYLKVLLDTVFCKTQFRTEISWRRQSGHSDAKQGRVQYGNVRDIVFFYTKGRAWTWNWLHTAYDESYLSDFYKHVEPETGRRYRLSDLTGPGGAAKGNPIYEVMGVTRYWRFSEEKMQKLIAEGRVVQSRSGAVPAQKRYLDEMPGVPLQNDWNDIKPAAGRESLGYPTQKPLALLERIIAASSNEDDLVLDPFCGCGTTVHAAQKLNRCWIGIDITHLAIHLIKRRLNEAFPKIAFDIVGEPKDLDGARVLALQDKYEFQKWALSMIGAQPFKGGKKGGDRGVDGFLYIKPDGKETEKVIVSVKGGQSLNPAMVKDLIVTVDQEGAKMGVFLTLESPTKGMVTQAATAGFYKTEYGQFPKVQIVTVEALFGPSNSLHLPWQDTSVFQKGQARECRKAIRAGLVREQPPRDQPSK
jgi:UDP-N-acetylglucosamine transferase subunit ALG13